MTDRRADDGDADRGDAEEVVDPRYDPRFQRGYDPGRDGTPPPAGSPREPGAQHDDPGVIRGMPGAPVHSPIQGDPREPGEGLRDRSHDASRTPFGERDGQDDELDEEGYDDPAAQRRSLVWIAVLAVVSGVAVVAGAISVVLLDTRAPLRFETAASSASAASHFALELVSGPVLVVGLLGAAVALALYVTGRRQSSLPREAAVDDAADPDRPER